MVGLPGRALTAAVAPQEQLSSGLVQVHRSALQQPKDVKAMAKPAQLKARRCWGNMVGRGHPAPTPVPCSSSRTSIPHRDLKPSMMHAKQCS